ncbi:MAG: hypothetical protein RLZZ320_768 [Actinomycetota bacterium]
MIEPEPQVNLRNHLPPGDLFARFLRGKNPFFARPEQAGYSHAPVRNIGFQELRSHHGQQERGCPPKDHNGVCGLQRT